MLALTCRSCSEPSLEGKWTAVKARGREQRVLVEHCESALNLVRKLQQDKAEQEKELETWRDWRKQKIKAFHAEVKKLTDQDLEEFERCQEEHEKMKQSLLEQQAEELFQHKKKLFCLNAQIKAQAKAQAKQRQNDAWRRDVREMEGAVRRIRESGWEELASMEKKEKTHRSVVEKEQEDLAREYARWRQMKLQHDHLLEELTQFDAKAQSDVRHLKEKKADADRHLSQSKSALARQKEESKESRSGLENDLRAAKDEASQAAKALEEWQRRAPRLFEEIQTMQTHHVPTTVAQLEKLRGIRDHFCAL
eukprot:s245_g10.t1